jgi:hypothetical protein
MQQDADPASLASERLNAIWRLKNRTLTCDFRHGLLRIRGKVSTWHQKQVVQAALVDIPGVNQLINEVEVADSAPVSPLRVL